MAAERRFGEAWARELARGRCDGVVRTDVDARTLCDLLVGTLNGTSTTSPAARRDLDAVVETLSTLLAPAPPITLDPTRAGPGRGGRNPPG